MPGPASCSDDPQEARELTKLSAAKLLVNAKELVMSDTEATKEELSKSRPRSRIWKLVQDQKLGQAEGIIRKPENDRKVG